MENKLKRFENKKILMVGGNESIGVPCSVLGKNKKGFMQLLYEELIKEGINIDVIDLFSMFINKSWNFDEVLKHNLTIEEIKNMQKSAVMVNREDFFNRIFISKELEHLSEVKKEDNKKRITDLMKEYEDVLMIYQSGSNNLMYQMQANPLGAVLDINMRNRALSLMQDKQTLNNVISNMDKNLNNILSINNNIELFVLSLYVPKLFSMLSKRNDNFKTMVEFIEEFNFKVKSLAYNYGVNYVDITPISNYCAKGGMDIHCTRKGHELLARIMFESIKESNKIKHVIENEFDYDNKGLNGMIEDALKRKVIYENALTNDCYKNTILEKFNDADKRAICESLVNEHQREQKVYEIAKGLCK